MQEPCETIQEEIKAKTGTNGLPNLNGSPTIGCQTKKIPLWLVLLDNVPTLSMFILGAMIISLLSVPGAIVYAAYAAFSIYWFWSKICVYCHHYDSRACPCGYGKVSAKLFDRKSDRSFVKVFKNNLGIVFPNWFVPTGVAAYLLYTQYSQYLLGLSIAFGIIAFAIIPLISKVVGCKSCDIKDDCPWMQMISAAKK